MKLLCILSAFIVVLLSARPCCADDCAAKNPVNQTAHKSAQKEKECPGCSPFFSCGTCVGFVIAKAATTSFIPQAEPVKHSNTYQQPNIEEIASAIWQPPQLV